MLLEKQVKITLLLLIICYMRVCEANANTVRAIAIIEK